MKVIYTGNLSIEEFSKMLAKTIEDYLIHAEADPSRVQLSNPIVQTSFSIDGSDPLVLETENGEMLQVAVDVMSLKDNMKEQTEDKRLWSREKLLNLEPTEAPTETIESDYRPKDLEYVTEIDINNCIVQEVFNIIGEEGKQLLRYININISSSKNDGIIAEEVVENRS